MRHALITLALWTAACAEEPAALDGQAPPPGTPEFVVSGIEAGGSIRLSWGGLPPGAAVTFAGSSARPGPGPCLPVLGGACLEIRRPVVLGQATADAAGFATLTRPAPGNLPRGTYQFQAVAVAPTGQGLLSNVFERASGPVPCGFNLAFVCGYDGVSYDNECLAHSVGMSVEYFGECIP
jgi:hypothetical protein